MVLSMLRFLSICLGGAIGSGARYLLCTFAQAMLGSAFPYGTLAVNLIGSFLICAVMRLGLASDLVSPSVRLFLTTGILGGFTTYSAFDYETFRMSQQGSHASAAFYVALTVVSCFLAGMAGDFAAKLLVRA
jgi:CrcB protein